MDLRHGLFPHSKNHSVEKDEEDDDDEDEDVEGISKKIKFNSGEYQILPNKILAKDILQPSTLKKHANFFLSFMNFLSLKSRFFIPKLPRPENFHRLLSNKTKCTLIPPDVLREF